MPMNQMLDGAFFLNLTSAVDYVLSHREQLRQEHAPFRDGRLLEALALYHQKQHEEAQKAAEQLLSDFPESSSFDGGPEYKAFVVTLLARCYASRGLTSQGVQLLEHKEIQAYFTSTLASSSRNWILAHFYKVQGRYLDAREKLQIALDEVYTSTHPRNAFRIVSDLANVYFALGDAARAITLYESALSEFEEDPDYAEPRIRTRCNLASVYQSISRNEDALTEYDNLLRQLDIGKEWATSIAILLNRAIALKSLSRMEESLAAYEEVRRLSHNRPDSEMESRAFIGISEHAKQRDDIGSALFNAKEALRIAENGAVSSMILESRRRIGSLEHLNGNNTVAIEILRDCFNRCAELGDHSNAIKIADELVEICEESGQLPIALETLRESSKIQRSVYEAEVERAVEMASLRSRIAKEKEEARVRDEERTRVLHAVMPAHIANRLTAGERQIVDTLPAVTIMFADVVGFTEHVSSMSGEELLDLLSKLFAGLDAAASAYECERIKTIGDSYMAICGASQTVDDHVERIARMALAAVSGDIELPIPPSKLRIGINTGPVIAGVMDGQRISYDVWGDTVNVAARMEEHSLPGKINCTEAVARKLMLHPEFTLIQREPLNVQGKGLMSAYWVESR